MKIIGLMSGTSADGVDACLVEIGAYAPHSSPRIMCDILAFQTLPYSPEVRRRVLDVATVEEVCALNFELGELFAEAVRELCGRAGVAPDQVYAVGSHGQTVCHIADRQDRSTLQIGEPAVIAQKTGIMTVADFRPRDIAAGGCGAPLVPAADFMLLANDERDRITLNIGGIANVTIMPSGRDIDGIVAFDTGPGNMVIDALMDIITRGREPFDRDGAAAARGEVCRDMLNELLKEGYFHKEPPKSTGREMFGRPYAEKLLEAGRSRGLSDDDIIATATALTVKSIARSIRAKAPATRIWDTRVSSVTDTSGPFPPELVVSGGGARNETMMNMLRKSLPGMKVIHSDKLGIPADAKEAVAFAVLAYLTLAGQPGNVLGATGAKERVVLGKIVPGRRTE
jgi:anhydro-N-acetylmuramic acid kinase